MKGLSTEEVNNRLKEFGYNELVSSGPKNVFRIAIEVLKEPMFILLISCGVLYMLLGDYNEGIILVSTIFIIIGITFYQSQKTEKALDALKKLSSPRALVIRDGVEKRIPGREVVPDDIIIYNEGDRVAADGIVLDTNHLTIDESLLTGESVPVNKKAAIDKKDNEGLVFSGTLVVQGRGVIKVTATGRNTEFGKIGTSLESIEEDSTRLQKEMKVLIRNLFIIGAVISVGVILLYYFTRGNILQSVLNGLTSAMAILPEEFPVVLTVFLALGAWRLSKVNVLTRKPSAIETLGSATVLCSDKTGTITQNKMELAVAFTNEEIVFKNQFSAKSQIVSDLIVHSYQACQKNTVDPMEKAVSESYNSFVSENTIDLEIIKEYPLSKQLLAMTRVLKNKQTNKISVSTKGAPETIFELCKLTEAEKIKYLTVVNELASKGYRILGVASSQSETDKFPETQSELDLKFIGLIGFEDPIRPEVPQAIKECADAGVKVIMITGDYPATAKSIGKKIGLPETGLVMTGEELSALSDQELKNKIESISIFARVVPEQKLRIVNALKENGEVVAMTGDGVNDAPALKAANIGVAMGNKGTDVAREASSLVLLDDNFASIISAIRSGRRIFDNLQKAMSYIIAIHIPIVGLSLLPAFVNTLPLILLPLHIVFMELIIDPVCSIAFESEQEEKGIMNRPPRAVTETFFGRKKILYSVFQGILLLIVVTTVYFMSLNEGHTEGEVRAIAFSSLIIGNIFLILTDLSKTRSFIAVIKERNLSVMLILPLAFVMLMLTISVPELSKLFSFEFPGFSHFIPSVIGSLCMLFVLEGIKYFRLQRTQ